MVVECKLILERRNTNEAKAVSNEWEEIPVYSGNYDYYLMDWTYEERNLRTFDLIAKARQ